MNQALKTPPAANLAHPPAGSALAPLSEPLFRSLWIAAVISYTGTWMQNVGAGWLMTQLTMSPLMVSLVTAATTLPVFLVILPAGALADLVDRRRFLLITQSWMVVAAALLGILTLRTLRNPVDASALHLHPRTGRGHERSRLAGHHSGNRFARQIMLLPWL